MAKMTVFLIAHSCMNGSNVAQARVRATTERAARNRFGKMHPDRVITTTGIKGKA